MSKLLDDVRNIIHSFATHLLHDKYDIRTIQDLLEHKETSTIIYTHVLQNNWLGVRSPVNSSH